MTPPRHDRRPHGVGTRALLDLMARYRFSKHWSLTANLRNTTDEKYLNSLLWDQNYYGEPRSASVTLNWAY